MVMVKNQLYCLNLFFKTNLCISVHWTYKNKIIFLRILSIIYSFFKHDFMILKHDFSFFKHDIFIHTLYHLVKNFLIQSYQIWFLTNPLQMNHSVCTNENEYFLIDASKKWVFLDWRIINRLKNCANVDN